MYFHLDRTPACKWTGDSPNLLSCLSTTVLTLSFEESLCGSQLLNHIVEDTSRVKHRLDRVFRDLFKVVRGRWWSEESVLRISNDSKYQVQPSTPHPLLSLSSSFKVIVLLLLYSTWQQVSAQYQSFPDTTSESKLLSGSMQKLQYLRRSPAKHGSRCVAENHKDKPCIICLFNIKEGLD